MQDDKKKLAVEVGKAGLSCVPFVGLGMWAKSFGDTPPEERGWMFWGEGVAQTASAVACVFTFGASTAITAPITGAIGAVKVAKIAKVAGTAATTIYTAEAGYVGKELVDSHLANKSAEQEAQIQEEKKQHDDEAKALIIRKEEAKAEEKSLAEPHEEKSGAKALIGILTLLAMGMISKKPSAESFNEKMGSGNAPHDIETKTTKELAVV